MRRSSRIQTTRDLVGVALGSVEAIPATSAIPTDANTRDEIKAYLDSQGIAYPANALKAELLALV